ncbi:MAG: hypothetical protein H6830_08210 [Planctomycetes bacterium]|nr:hypothetical protein [Planctomycetota bacterium]MCB9909741.1 hypothetical protein [Planctomycetota bacterium]HPF13793.1 hypothetical protein [Planctomycetota bacterium]
MRFSQLLLLLVLACWGPLAQAGNGPAQAGPSEAPERGWREVLLPVDQPLLLGPTGSWALQSNGKYWKAQGTFEWGALDPALPTELGADQVARNESPNGVTVEVGQQLLYRLKDGTWGLIKVLHVQPSWLRVEQLVLESGDRLGTEANLDLRGSSEPDGYQLSWDPAPGQTFLVERWVVGQPEAAVALEPQTEPELFDRSAPRNTLLEYSVRRADDFRPATRLRLLRQEQPIDWPIPLETGLTLDLVTGAVGSAEPDLEVHQIVGSQVFLRAAEGCPLSMSGRGDPLDSWEAPPFGGRTYLPHIRSVEIGSSAFFYRSDLGLYGRIALQQDTQGRVYLRRSLDLDGGRWMPLPPHLEQWSCDQEGIHLYFQALNSYEVKELGSLDRVVELERIPGSGVWEELAVWPAAENEQVLVVQPDRTDLPLVSLRFRHRYGKQSISMPSDPVAILVLDPADEAASQMVQKAALQALSSDAYAERFLAENVLVCLGSQAWPALLERYSDEEGIGSDLARQILLSPEGVASGQLEQVMLRAGAQANLPEPVPLDWFDRDAAQRIYHLLLDHGQPDRGPWLELVKRLDPDVRVRQMASLLLASPGPANPIVRSGIEGIWSSIPPAERPAAFWPDWVREFDGAGPRDAAAAIRSSVDGERLQEAQALLALARQAEVRGDPRDPYARVLLGLGLVDLYRQKRSSVLLQAVREGVVEVGAGLAAWRDLMEWRLRAPTEGMPQVRPRIRLESASLAELQETLTDLATSRESYVDVVLPSGTYHALPGLESWLDLTIPGLALIGEGEVELMVGLRANEVPDLIVANVTVDHRNGGALALTGSSMTLRNVILSGAQTPVALQDANLELEACEIRQGEGKESVVAVRLLGPCLVLARGSRFDAGGWVLGDRGEVYLDRCTIDSGSRPVFQGQRGGYLVLRDCALLGGSASFQGLAAVSLEGVLEALLNQSLGPPNESVSRCPEHNLSSAPPQPGAEAELLDRCPLSTER